MPAIIPGGEHCIVGIPGTTLDPQTRQALEELQPAGIILFGRNIMPEGSAPTRERAQQLFDLIAQVQGILHHLPFIAIDQEGGRVSRLKILGNEPPSASELTQKGDLRLIQQHGTLTGQILSIFGFNLDLCPVLDINFNDKLDNSLKGRTWGQSPAEVIEHTRIFTQALRNQGILSCGKHFPGYSACEVDPHWELPVVRRTREELEATEWRPYCDLLAQLDSIMVGHAAYPELDPSREPASLSKTLIDGILRKTWNYQGCVISDDLDMGAIVNRGDFSTSVRQAVEAGNDLLLLCHRLPEALEAARGLGSLSPKRVAEAKASIAAFRAKLPKPPTEFDWDRFQAVDKQIGQLRIDTVGADAAARRSPEDGKRSPVETY